MDRMVNLKKQLKKVCFCLSAALLFSACAQNTQKTASSYKDFKKVGNEQIMFDNKEWGELNTHDPSVVKDGNSYYVFSTDASYGDAHGLGIQIRKSDDLISWEYVGTAFENFEEDCAEAIKYAKLDVSKHQGLWAPDVAKVGGKYRMYYSASTFGSSRSCIGLAEADKITGPYKDKGIVIKSEVNAVTMPNSIDPAFITDKNGDMYMSYGSFFGGIFITKLGEDGFVEEGFEPIRIAGSRHAAIEGSYIVYIPQSDYYYLFVSYGSLSSDYNIRVARSKEVTGPYIDANGKEMTLLGGGNGESVGTKLMGGYTFTADPGVPATKGFMAPGHNSALIDGEDYFIVHHVRTYTLPDYWFYMNVRRFSLNKYGWPVIAPNRYTGEKIAAVEFEEGDYGFIQHLSDSNAQSHSSEIITMEGGSIQGAVSGTYTLYDDYKIQLEIDGTEYDGVLLRQYDWEREREVMSFTAMSETGLTVWGSTQLYKAEE